MHARENTFFYLILICILERRLERSRENLRRLKAYAGERFLTETPLRSTADTQKYKYKYKIYL